MVMKRRQPSISKAQSLLISTSSKLPRRLELFKLAVLFSSLLVLLSAGTFQGALADSPGGQPTNTPRPTDTPTPTATSTLTFTPPPTLTSAPKVNIPLVIAPGATTAATPKALPTGTLLTLDEISATLQAQGANEPAERSNFFWLYLLIIFAVAASVVVIVIISLTRQKQQPPPTDQEQP